jgi:hypothetical protein
MSENPRFPYLLSAALADATPRKTKHSQTAKHPEDISWEDSYIQMRGVLRPNDQAQRPPGGER